MKKVIFCVLPLAFISCTSKHLHDGTYKANVFTDASLSWVRSEEIELKGSDMYYRSVSVVDGSIGSEFKTTCIQYQDRIEFKGKDGVDYVARIDNQGNISYGAYTYKKVGADEPSAGKQ